MITFYFENYDMIAIKGSIQSGNRSWTVDRAVVTNNNASYIFKHLAN